MSDIPRRQTVFPSISSCCPTPKTCVKPLKFLCYLVNELRFTLFPIYSRMMAIIFDFRHNRTSNSLRTSHSMLPDPENMTKTVKMSLLSCIRAEIHINSCLRTVYGRHLRFPTDPGVAQFSYSSLRVAQTRKHR